MDGPRVHIIIPLSTFKGKRKAADAYLHAVKKMENNIPWE